MVAWSSLRALRSVGVMRCMASIQTCSASYEVSGLSGFHPGGEFVVAAKNLPEQGRAGKASRIALGRVHNVEFGVDDFFAPTTARGMMHVGAGVGAASGIGATE